MRIVVIADELQRKELAKNISGDAEIIWITVVKELHSQKTDAVIDLLFKNEKERIELLEKSTATVIINSVIDTLSETNENFIRINGWNTFLQSSLIEASAKIDSQKEKAVAVFKKFNKQFEWVPDMVGFITPRVVCMIVNEAYFALSEGVSTKEEINTAMKLGTNYPLGPFEWAERIGIINVLSLLKKLSVTQPRYEPCTLLVIEANNSMLQTSALH